MYAQIEAARPMVEPAHRGAARQEGTTPAAFGPSLVDYDGHGGLFVLVLALTVSGWAAPPDAAWAAWVAVNAAPVAYDLDTAPVDLDVFSELIGDATVVAIGEGTHGTAEFHEARDRLTRWLVEEHGFTVVVPEMALAGSERVRAYVESGVGDPDVAADHVGGWVWNSRENVAALTWMRGHHGADDRVQVWPMDVQRGHEDLDALARLAGDLPEDLATSVRAASEARPVPRAAVNFGPMISTTGERSFAGWVRGSVAGLRAAPVCQLAGAAKFDRIKLAPETWVHFEVELPPDGDFECVVAAAGAGTVSVDDVTLSSGGAVLTRFDARSGGVSVEPAAATSVAAVAHSGEPGWAMTMREIDIDTFVGGLRRLGVELAHQGEPWAGALSTAAASGFELESLRQQERGSERDRLMANQVLWYLEHLDPGSKVVVWAHNEHVRTDGAGTRDAAMGAWLRASLGDNYVSIGTLTSTGEYRAASGGVVDAWQLGAPHPGCIELAFNALPIDSAVVVLPGAEADRKLSRPIGMRTIGASAELVAHWQFVPSRSLPAAFDALWWVRATSATRDGASAVE